MSWNHLPKNIKSSDTLETFKEQIKSWTGSQCKCAYCKFVNDTDPYNLLICKILQVCYDILCTSLKSLLELYILYIQSTLNKIMNK